jgi:16S rRNA (adenine(1408)-N(1))-methyltransferase
VIVDLGCGDGRATLALAAAEPGALVLGVDPVAGAMAESSRRARRSAKNALFVAASAEAVAAELPATADRVVLLFPWAALLRGALGLEPAVGCAIASLVRSGGVVDAFVSVTARDHAAGVVALPADPRPSPDLLLDLARQATREEVIASRSTWGRRLLANGGADRPVWRFVWSRA